MYESLDLSGFFWVNLFKIYHKKEGAAPSRELPPTNHHLKKTFLIDFKELACISVTSILHYDHVHAILQTRNIDLGLSL